MMEKDSEVSRCRVLVALLFTEDSNNSQKHTCGTYYSPNPHLSVLFTYRTPISPCLAQRGPIIEGLLYRVKVTQYGGIPVYREG